ncbi:hypothetical protein [Comamonas testosteroni]|uniref:hypothetical protein n=1 Tax=Comamonas testosteroni TaxID=285 RepID=UPI00391D4083
MQENKARKPRGRQPIGGKAMTGAERQRKRDAKLKDEGVRMFRMSIYPHQLGWIEQMAKSNEVSLTAALANVLEVALDRYAGVMKRVQFLEVDCSNPEAAAAFIQAHLSPALPTLEELAAQFKKET